MKVNEKHEYVEIKACGETFHGEGGGLNLEMSAITRHAS